jgi:hypothetical protein
VSECPSRSTPPPSFDVTGRPTSKAGAVRGSPGRRAGTVHCSRSLGVMDKQTKREVWLLAIGTALVELPVAFAAFTILSH